MQHTTTERSSFDRSNSFLINKHNYVMQISVYTSIPVTERFKARVCGRSLAGTADSNSAGGMDVSLLWMVCVVSTGLCDGPIPLPKKSYRLWCVTVCDLETSRIRRPWPALGCYARRNKNVFVQMSLLQRCYSALAISGCPDYNKKDMMKCGTTSHLWCTRILWNVSSDLPAAQWHIPLDLNPPTIYLLA